MFFFLSAPKQQTHLILSCRKRVSGGQGANPQNFLVLDFHIKLYAGGGTRGRFEMTGNGTVSHPYFEKCYRETCQDKLVDTVPSILKTVKQEALILDLGLLGDHVEVLRMTFKKCETLKMKSIKIRLSSTDPRDQRKATAKVKQKHSPNTFSATVASLLQSMCTRHLRNRTLSVLEIQSVQLSSNAINHLREALLHNKSIKTFSLSGTRIGDCGIKELTVPLRNLISMTSLDLSNCKLSDNARDAVKSIINGHNATRKQLMYADSLRNRVVRPIRGLGLEQIGLSHNMMSDPTCAMFQETLREDTFIQKLILSHNRITPKGAGHLNRLLSINSSISFIDISNNFDERSPIPLKHCSLQFKNFGLGRLMFISNSNSQQCDDLEDVISEDSQLDRIETAVPQTVSSSLDHAGEVGRFDHSVDDNLQCRSSAEDLLCDHPVTTLRELLQMVPGHANSSHVRVDVLEQCVAHDLKRLRVHGVSQLAPIVRKLKSEQKSIVSFDELRTLSNELTLPSATDEAVPRDLVLRMLMTAKHFPDSTQELVHMIKSGTPPLAIHTKLSDLGIGVDGSSPEPTGHVQRYPSTASPPPLQPVSDEAWNSQTPADLRQEVVCYFNIILAVFCQPQL